MWSPHLSSVLQNASPPRKSAFSLKPAEGAKALCEAGGGCEGKCRWFRESSLILLIEAYYLL